MDRGWCVWVRIWGDGGCVEMAERRNMEEEVGVEHRNSTYLIGIHPGRGAEEPCRKATVIYEQWKLLNGWHPPTLKENPTLRLTHIVYHQLVILGASV